MQVSAHVNCNNLMHMLTPLSRKLEEEDIVLLKLPILTRKCEPFKVHIYSSMIKVGNIILE